MKMRIAGLVEDSIVDGPGLRLTVFAQGCPHRCPGCHNPHSWDPEGGREIDTAEIERRLARNPLLSGVTLSGGEPFAQAGAMAQVARNAKTRGLHVMVFSGDQFETLLERARSDDDARALLEVCDVLVDGRFDIELRTLMLPWRGSSNQRLIDLPASLEAGQAVLWRAQEFAVA